MVEELPSLPSSSAHSDVSILTFALNAGSFTSTLIGTGAPGSGSGPALSATLNHPTGIAILPGSTPGGVGGAIWLDQMSCLVRIWNATTDQVSTLAGSVCGFADGALSSAQFGPSLGLVWHPLGEGGHHALS